MKIGVIGLGDMGKLYARQFARAGLSVSACDRPEKMGALASELAPLGVELLPTGEEVSRNCDLILYSVEARNIESAVKRYGPHTREGAIVAGQTAVKSVEIDAFEKYLRPATRIVTIHSLHGPSLGPAGQKIVIIRHRCDDPGYAEVKAAFASLGSTMVELADYREHDRMTADIQAVTHLCFESMGTAWKDSSILPWESAAYSSVIDEVKILMALRIFSGKAHVYSEIAMLNPYALLQMEEYAKSVSELFKLMLSQNERELRHRVIEAGEVFLRQDSSELLLRAEVVEELNRGLSERRALKTPSRNSHLSLLAMADVWKRTGVNPYRNLVCRTPPYLLRVGIVELLFRHNAWLESAIEAGLRDREGKPADLDFLRAVFDWALVIRKKDHGYYTELFESAQAYLRPQIEAGKSRSDELIRLLGCC